MSLYRSEARALGSLNTVPVVSKIMLLSVEPPNSTAPTVGLRQLTPSSDSAYAMTCVSHGTTKSDSSLARRRASGSLWSTAPV